jgi:hypothetical protein
VWDTATVPSATGALPGAIGAERVVFDPATREDGGTGALPEKIGLEGADCATGSTGVLALTVGTEGTEFV